jgi:ABC-type lipoprotein release transport system permease subunit
MAWVEGRYAARSLRRNTRRSVLAVTGIAVGCLLVLVMEGFNRGRDELFARAGAYSGAGHLRVVPDGWRDHRDVRSRLADWRADLAAARALPGAAAVAPRARAEVLLAMGTHVAGTEVVGVDPAVEPATNRLVRTIHAGRYLAAGESGAVVLGEALAARLTAGLDDDVLASAVGPDGRIESAMFRIAGIVRTGSEDADLLICHVSLADLASLTGRPGAGEIAVVLADWRRTAEQAAELASRVAPGDAVITWDELNPELKGHMRQDQRTSQVISLIILLIVFLGVTSAELAAVLERRREFAVLSALGMGAWTMVRLVLLEAAAIGLAGGLIGLAVGTPIVWRLAHTGLDFSRYFGSSYSFGGFLLEPVIYMDFGWWIPPYVVSVAVGATMIASLYPAMFAARTDPAAALRVAQ